MVNVEAGFRPRRFSQGLVGTLSPETPQNAGGKNIRHIHQIAASL
jgi:hypothetical protein